MKMTSISPEVVAQLKASLGPTVEVITPDSDKYADSIKRWASSAERPAGLVVYPLSEEDVSKTILFITAHKLELAVVGGGHATSGSSSTAGGVCIDLSKMRAVTVDVDKQTVTAQGGALWEHVDAAAAEHGLAAVGGTVNHTGIGGLTLGGGYGWLSGEHGLVIDNLLAVTLVLASGEIATCSDAQNPDLFWAARGAGVGFGVATSFTYRAHPQPNPVWGGMVVFPPPALEKVIEFANHSLAVASGKHSLIVGFGTPPPTFQPAVLAILFYNGPEEDAKAFYAPLFALSPLANMTATMPYAAVNTMLNAGLSHGFRRTMKGSAFIHPVSFAFAQSLFEDLQAFLAEVPSAVHTVILLECLSYHKIVQVKQTDTAFANRGAFGNLLFGPGWTDPALDDRCREWAREMGRKGRREFEKAKSLGTDSVTSEGVGEYVNYDSFNSSAETVFGVNYPRLAELKKKYDPTNVFCKGPNLLL